MGLRKNKKGFWLTYMDFLMLLIVLIYTFAVIQEHQNKHLSEFKYIGIRSLDLMNTYSQAQLNLTYYDSLSNIIFPKTLYELGASAGFYYENDCGSYINYNLWNNEDDYCFPNYKSSINDFFNRVRFFYELDNRFIISYLGHGTFTATSIDYLELNKDDVTYTLRPNLKFNSGYDFNIYETAFEKTKQIVDVCKNEFDFSFCVKERLAHFSRMDEKFEWKEDCNRNEERVFYSFIKQYKECVNSMGNDCYCKIDMDKFQGYVDGIEMKIKIESNGNISSNNLNYKFDFDPTFYGSINNIRNPHEIYLLLKYDSSGNLLKFGINERDIELSQLTSSQKVAPLFLYKMPADEFNPNNYVLVSDYKDKFKCRIFTRYATICIENQNEFMIYNFDYDRLERKKIPLKFSIYVPDEIPPDPILFSVKNKPYDRNRLLLNFNRSDAYDISHYNVYIEQFSFNSINDLDVKYVIEDQNYFLNEILFEIPVEDNVLYYVTVTPVDVFGNENENILVKSVQSFNNQPSNPISDTNVEILSSDGDQFEFNPGINLGGIP